MENPLPSSPPRSFPPTSFGQDDGELGALVSVRCQQSLRQGVWLSGVRQAPRATSFHFCGGDTAGLWNPCSWVDPGFTTF